MGHGLLSFIQFSEHGEHERQAMVRKSERMIHGLVAECHSD